MTHSTEMKMKDNRTIAKDMKMIEPRVNLIFGQMEFYVSRKTSYICICIL